MGLWRRIEHGYVKPWLRSIKPWRKKTFAGVRVHYMKHLDGGGSSFGQDYIPLFRRWDMPKQGRAFEWCSGPGFIGFALLGSGLCESLCLADINPQAVEACRRTIADNRLGARVSVYHSDNLADIPPHEQWDVVVSNPPHFVDDLIGDLRGHDPDWRIHRGFYAGVAAHLNPGAVLVLQENNRGSTAETFRAMIEEAGLHIVFVHAGEPRRTTHDHFYYIGVMRRTDVPPDWVRRAAAGAR
jgi:methylase of polypeptide subunit release factors